MQLHSALSDEIFSGVITAVGAEDIIVKLGTGARLRVFVAQLRDRRYAAPLFVMYLHRGCISKNPYSNMFSLKIHFRVTLRIDQDAYKELEISNVAKRAKTSR